MDALYQAVKSFLKSIVNLFVALIELISGLINLLASLLTKPFSKQNTGKTSVISSEYKEGDFDVALVSQVRSELQQRITGKDAYILERARIEIFENSRIAGRKKRLYLAVKKILLEEEFKDAFLAEPVLTEETTVEEPRIPSICEISKEAIG